MCSDKTVKALFNDLKSTCKNFYMLLKYIPLKHQKIHLNLKVAFLCCCYSLPPLSPFLSFLKEYFSILVIIQSFLEQ